MHLNVEQIIISINSQSQCRIPKFKGYSNNPATDHPDYLPFVDNCIQYIARFVLLNIQMRMDNRKCLVSLEIYPIQTGDINFRTYRVTGMLPGI